MLKNKLVAVNPDRCTGCRICELICSLEHNKVLNPARSRIRVVNIHPNIITALTCRLCEDPPCVTACPRDALKQSLKTGLIVVDDEKCDGCGWCIEACDFGAVVLNPNKKVVEMCDLCEEREKGPACIEWCPEEALELTSKEIRAQKARIDAVAKLLKAET